MTGAGGWFRDMVMRSDREAYEVSELGTCSGKLHLYLVSSGELSLMNYRKVFRIRDTTSSTCATCGLSIAEF